MILVKCELLNGVQLKKFNLSEKEGGIEEVDRTCASLKMIKFKLLSDIQLK